MASLALSIVTVCTVYTVHTYVLIDRELFHMAQQKTPFDTNNNMFWNVNYRLCVKFKMLKLMARGALFSGTISTENELFFSVKYLIMGC